VVGSAVSKSPAGVFEAFAVADACVAISVADAASAKKVMRRDIVFPVYRRSFRILGFFGFAC